MENIQNSLINMAAPKVNQTKKPSGSVKGETQEKDSGFRKMMESQKSEQAAGEKAESPKSDAESKTGEGEVPADQELEHRMALAAMALMTAPAAIQTAPVEPEAEVQPELAVVQVGEETPVMAQQPETEAVVQPAEEGMEMPEDTVDKVVQTKAPETRSVEQPVQHRETVTERAPVQDKPEQEETKVTEAQTAPEQPLFREVKAVPIQVGEAPAAEKPAEPAPVQVGQRLAEAIRAGESHVELELTPNTLGKVHIELSMHKDGTLHVLLRAEKASTQELLHRDAGDLQGMLGRETRQEVYVRTERYQEEQSQFHQENQQDRGHQQSRQEQHQQHRDREDSENFLHQLRLGLTSL